MGRDGAYHVPLELIFYFGQTLKQNKKYEMMINAKEKNKVGKGKRECWGR